MTGTSTRYSTRRALQRATLAALDAAGATAARGTATGSAGTSGPRAERRAVTVQYWSRWGGSNPTAAADTKRMPLLDQERSVKKAISNMAAYANTRLASG